MTKLRCNGSTSSNLPVPRLHRVCHSGRADCISQAAFDVVKDKLMKNIQERANALKAVRGELETKEQALRRTQRQKQEAERGLLEMRSIFEDMKRIEHMKRGCEVSDGTGD